ncbi:60S ribosomal protein L37, partial [Phytophthora nicotianae]
APQQDPHHLQTVWSQLLPHPEEHLLFVWLPRCQDAQVQLEPEGPASPHDGHWPHAPPEERPASFQERLP